MTIKFKYMVNKAHSPKTIEVYANEAQIGLLSDQGSKDQLSWSPDLTHNVAFQFRNEDTFRAVVKELKRYKNEHGYKYLMIWTYDHEYASVLDKGMLERAGFRHLSDQHPACMFLE